MNKRISIIILFVVVLLVPNDANSLSWTGDFSKSSLIGIKSIQLNINAEQISTLNEDNIINDIKLKLLNSKIKVDKLSRSILGIRIYLEEETMSKLLVYQLQVSLFQTSRLLRNNAKIISITWHDFESGIVGNKKVDTLRDRLKDLLDGFIIDYLIANPVKL